MESTSIPIVGDGESGALAILGEIVHVQREYMREGDPQRMWDELLSALMRTTSSHGGFIGEVEWSPRGIPSLNTRAMVWDGENGSEVALHPDIGLLVSRIIAEQAPVLIDLSRVPGAAAKRAPIGQFLGMPLLSSDRLVGLVGLSDPEEPYGDHWVERLQPLLSACASIVESLQAASDRSRLLGELERTAGFLQAVINASTHAILVTSPEGLIETANPAANRLLDSPEGALVGTPVSDFVAATDERRTRALLRWALRHGIAAGTEPLVTSVVGFSGGRKQVEVSVGEMVLDGERRLVLLLHDITDRLQAQAALARAAEVIDATPDLILWADPECRIVYMNEGGMQMLGFDDDLDITRITIDSLAPADQTVFRTGLETARSEGVWRGDVEFGTMDGERVPVSVVVIADDAYVAVLARDLTERHEIERLKESFVANISHELRTPLTAVIGYLELLGEGVLGDLNDSQAEAVEVMTRNGERLLDLIGDILLIGSLDAGSELTRRPVDLSALVGGVVSAFASMQERKALELEVTCEDDCVVHGDESELKTVASNVIGNALKFTPEYGSVRVVVRQGARGIILEVSDSGIGIAADELEHVFNRFYRGNDARRSEVQGAGLGLAIVHGVVQRHGGDVDIKSRVGTGTTVTVVLPRAEKGPR